MLKHNLRLLFRGTLSASGVRLEWERPFVDPERQAA